MTEDPAGLLLDVFGTEKPPPDRAWGEVAAVGPPVTVTFAGDTVATPVPMVAGGYAPKVGDTVLLLRFGTTWAVVGSPDEPAGDADWHVVGTAGEPAFENGWSNWGTFAPVRFRRLPSGLVVLSGLAATTTTNDGSTIFTLPSGYRVSVGNGLHFPAVWGDKIGTIQVDAAGAVKGRGFGATATWFSLDGATFYAEA